ncbi:MAG: putative Ig domain-containing protein [Verrucomicrobiota bacterium]|nr:putative Ig domain-containing protein [Verrucomicrobiota bacterium]
MFKTLNPQGQNCFSQFAKYVLPVAVLNLLGAAPLVAATYNWNSAQDAYTVSDIDLRYLNEQTAGQAGWVTYQDDGNFYTGDGKQVRFWGYTGSVEGTFAGQQERARFLAKRGINLHRWHTSVYSNSANTLDSVNMSSVDSLHRAVSANKQQGIYTEISYFFILGLRMQPQWEIDGYTNEWFAANPGQVDRAPFGLQFFDDKFKAAIKKWLEVILTTPNPYETDKRALKDDPAVAYIELQNEDNLFFWTFDPGTFPPEQQAKIAKKFGDYLVAKYGSISAAQAAWGSGAERAGDDPGNGRMVLQGAGSMTGVGGNSASSRRLADNIAFCTKTQYDFYVELSDAARALGYGGVLGGSNWTTADGKNLYDAELYTYTAAGVTDSHNYYGTYAYQGTNSPGPGDLFYSVATVENPRSGSVALKTVEGHPHVVSEVAWVNPSNHSSEGALVAAAYSSMRSYDGWIWFAYAGTSWDVEYETWPMAKPSVLGQFPGAALLYRRGDVDVASTLVREGKTLQSIANRQANIISSTFGWRLTDNPTTRFKYNPTTGLGDVDSAAMLAGGVDLAFDTDADFVSDKLATLIDNTKKTITSATGQLVSDATAKILTVNSPRSQAAVGYLKNKGDITLDDVIIRAGTTFSFGSVLVISLDGLPIGQSSKLLVQAGTQDNLTGYTTEPATISGLAGEKLISVGQTPWTLQEVDVRITLRNKVAADLIKVQPLNENGYAAGSPVAATLTPQGLRFSLPKNAMYTLVTMNPPADKAPVITTKNLTNAVTGKDYSAQLQALSGDGALTWTVTEGTTLPAGLSLSTSGLLSGRINNGNTDSFSVTVTDADGDAAVQSLFLISLPYGSISLLDTEGATFRFGDFAWNEKLGFLYDGFYPFVYSFNYQSWLYFFDGPGVTESGGYFLYDFSKSQFGYTQLSYYPWYFTAGGPNHGQPVDLSVVHQ